MSFGNPNHGLLKKIIDVIHQNGDEQIYDTNRVTTKIQESGYWDWRTAQTPERTVNSYFSQNSHIFERIYKNGYRLRRKYWDQKIDFKEIEIEEEIAKAELVSIDDFEQVKQENILLKESNEKLLKLIGEIRKLTDF